MNRMHRHCRVLIHDRAKSTVDYVTDRLQYQLAYRPVMPGIGSQMICSLDFWLAFQHLSMTVPATQRKYDIIASM